MVAMRLDELTTLEHEWLAKQHSVQGTHSDRDASYERIGAYEAWQAIFREYVILSREGDLEALKRALFLYWYEYSEPYWLTGIANLDRSLAEELLHRVNSLAGQEQLDEELKWMLPWYYSVADYYLNSFAGLDALEETSKRKPDWRTLRHSPPEFENRGQMGQYWKSVWPSPDKPWIDDYEWIRRAMQARESHSLLVRLIGRIRFRYHLWRHRIK